MHFRKLNNLTGWAVFGVAAFTYVRTVEPTASWWDCGEFIAAAYKLLIGHPPGAPFFLLVGRLFSLLAGGDVTQVAYWINISSALFSAFAILFLFWTITLLARKLAPAAETENAPAPTFAVLAAGVVGSLSYAFSDSFWFSAVEGEVYALSSLFTAFVVWAALRWERLTDPAAANRWLVLIAYVIGLSLGAHLLNLVTLPALALVYYFKQFKPTFRGGVGAVAAGGAVTLGLMTGLRLTLPSLAGKLDVFFVNSLGLPFGTGVGVVVLLLAAGLAYALYATAGRQKVVLNTALLGLTFVLVGFASYFTIVIRANQSPTFNLNDPKNVVGFQYYMNMEQYGSGRPLVYGPYFNTEVIDSEEGAPQYVQGKDKYEVYSHYFSYKYDPRGMTLLPRIYSQDRNHPQAYRDLLGLQEGQKPNMADNLGFLFSRQLGFWYGRYLLWNFAGRDSDKQDAGFAATLTPVKNLPPDLAGNRGHNRLYFLPLLLGLAGAVYQYRRGRSSFWFTALLFFMTGVALILYLNPPPTEPRERDYIYVGSFYAFSIWIGLGVMAVADALRVVLKREVLRPVLAGAACLGVPLLMVSQNWDDHDRSGRYIAVDSAKSILNACAPNAILLTSGDNDTYPLIYAQEVEGVRRDVRICISQFMGTDWYISQLKKPNYDGKALPITMNYENYVSAVNNQILFHENEQYAAAGISLPNYLKLIRENNPALKVPLQNGEMINILPSNKLVLPVDKEAVLKKGFVDPRLQPLLADRMTIELPKKSLLKDDLIFLDLLTHNNWERPIYFTSLFTAAQYNLAEYTQVEGMVYRLMPVRVPGARQGYVNAARSYENMMRHTTLRGVNDPDVYHDETSRNWLQNSRVAFLQTAEQLIAENQREKARQVLLKSLATIPDAAIPYDRICSLFVAPLLQVGEREKALQLARTMAGRADRNLAYYLGDGPQDPGAVQENLVILNQLATSLKEEAHPDAPQYQALFEKHYQKMYN